ncbi:MAG: hypothetical protein AB2770_03915 [Candidatus Thiodiazotropha taylori]
MIVNVISKTVLSRLINNVSWFLSDVVSQVVQVFQAECYCAWAVVLVVDAMLRCRGRSRAIIEFSVVAKVAGVFLVTGPANYSMVVHPNTILIWVNLSVLVLIC